MEDAENIDGTQKKKPLPKGLIPFVKGKSGNPGGRPKTNEAFRDRCRKFVDLHVVEMWEKEVQNAGEEKMKASELLAAYGYGKPAQAIQLTGEEGGPVEFVIKVTGAELP